MRRAFPLPALLAFVCALHQGAAEAAAQVVPTPLPGDTVELEEVRVTVLRTPIQGSAAPVAVSVLSGEALREARSGLFLEEVLHGLPGVQVQNRFNPAVGERIAIRGFGARAQFGVRGIRVVVDGIPATLPDGQSTLEHVDLSSLGRVEAIRGPASALYGNASGGVLAFHTRPPPPVPVRLEVEQAGGSHGLLRSQATAAGTMGETGYLLTVSSQSWDGFRRVLGAEEEGATYGRSSRWGLNARVTRPVAGGRLAVTANLLDLDAENPGSLARADRFDPDRPAFAGNVNQRLGKEVRQAQLGTAWDGALGGLEGRFSLFGVHREVVNPIPGNIIDLARDGAGARAQLARDVATPLGPLRWHAGVEAELMFDDRKNFANLGGEPGELRLDQRERVRSVGFFLQGDVPLPAGARGLAGLRYDRHDFRARDRFPRDAADPSATGERTMDQVSPSVGVHLPVGRSLGIFASVGTVFETPTTTELANRPEGAGGFNAELEPLRGTSGEVGLRGRVGERAAFELTAYRTDLRNELVPFELPDRTFFRNAGASRHTGFEATLSAASRSGIVSADLSYSTVDARFRRFEKAGEELSGNRVPGLAPQRGRAAVRVSPGHAFVEVAGSYLHRVPVDDENTEAAASYALVDVRAGARGLAIGNAIAAPWAAVTNALDRTYTASVVPNAFGGRFYEPGPGRSIQLGLRVTWEGS